MTVTATKHPATFSKPVVEAMRSALLDQLRASGTDIRPLEVLDPFAGVGGIHDVAFEGVITHGVELEPEWANQHDATICADSTDLTFWPAGSFDTIATSPAYGNRMADQYLPPDTDKSRRYTYATALRRKCSDNSGAALHWGDDYRTLHDRVWSQCDRLLMPGGRVLLNVKNHYRKGVEQDVAGWHLDWFLGRDYRGITDTALGTDGIKHSPNRQRCQERLIVLEKRAA